MQKFRRIYERRGKEEIDVCSVGKYIKLEDAYISVIESLKHAGFKNNVTVKVEIVDSETITEKNVASILKRYKAIVVPGGFGSRGIEGMIIAIKYARDVLKLTDANSEEFDNKTSNPVIAIMEEQKTIKNLGGTMRLGGYSCKINKNSKVYNLYKQEIIFERHRHRFEYNNNYREILKKNGLSTVGINEEFDLVEIVEIEKNDYFVECQFHPKFKSRPNHPGPLFDGLIKSAINKNDTIIC